VFVTTDNGDARGGDGPSHVFAYDSGGVASSDLVIAGQPEERVGGLAGVAVGPDRGDLAVVDPEGRRIVSVDMAAGTQAVRARIPDLPVCLLPLATVACQPGVEDREPFPVSVAYDGARHLFVTDPAQDTIWRLRPGESSPEVWYQSVHFTTGAGPHGIAVDGASVTFTVGASHDLSALGAGALYRLAVEPDGSAGELTFVHAFPRGEPPGALALGSSGAAYVVLGSSGAIVTIARDGSQTGRIDPPGTGPIPLDSPSAVALVHGGLLVANGRTSDDAERWAVLTLVVDDGPVSAAATTDDRLRIRPSGRVP
jgi:hypothetical protein